MLYLDYIFDANLTPGYARSLLLESMLQKDEEEFLCVRYKMSIIPMVLDYTSAISHWWI